MSSVDTSAAPVRFSCDCWPQVNEGHNYTDNIGKRDAGKTVLEFYQQQHLAAGTNQQWQTRIENGQVTNSSSKDPLTADTLLRAGDQITYQRLPWAEPEAPTFFDVLYEDEHVLAVCKPAGLQVLPKGVFCQRTLLDLLQLYHRQHRSLKYPDSLAPVPVHRLGRGTSGVLLCACTAEARQKLTRDFSTSTELGVASLQARATAESAQDPDNPVQRPLGKTYRALVSGVVGPDEGEVTAPIGLVNYPGLSSGLFAASADGKPARSLYRVLERKADSSILEVTILTGRPHQIRIHMAALGHPLVGDPLYGPGGIPKDSIISDQVKGSQGACGDADAVMPGDCGYHLHSMDLAFRHPVTGAKVVVSAPLPPVLQVTHQESTAAAN